MAKIRSLMSFSGGVMTVLDVAFSTWLKSDFSSSETDTALGNVRLSC
jgi:hypothetical protein